MTSMDRPPLTRAAIARVQDSYRHISRNGPLAPLFYARLFAQYPDTRALFPVDMTRQHAHFNVALAILVWNLEFLAGLDDPLHELGARHVGYGVRREHYAQFRDTLIELLAECAGDLWSPRLRDDWWEALTQVIAVLLDGASEPHLGETGAFRST
jgi:hemoglobin-like flavoprotein